MLKTLARLLAWPAMLAAIFASGVSGSYYSTTLEARPARLLVVIICLTLPPALVALVFNPFLRDRTKPLR